MRGDANGSNHTSPSPPRTTIGSSPGRKSRLSNGSANATSSTNGSSHMNGDSPVHLRHTQPTFYGHDREELTRILIQSLNDLGYESSAGGLSRESGYDLETGHAAAFRIAVLQGEWAEAEALLLPAQEESPGSGGVSIETRHDGTSEGRSRHQKSETRPLLSPDTDHREMLFLLRKQKYLELLEERDLSAALHVLQQELGPLNQDEDQLHKLSGLIMCHSAEELKSQTNWDGATGESRKLLLSDLSRYISPSVMIPEHRMATLLTELKDLQSQHCLYHSSQHPLSLYSNHVCDRADFPLETMCELDRHTSEVWFLAFSNDGTRLATASLDMVVLIYDTTSFRLVHILAEHKEAIVYLSWSPDDTRLITCSKDTTAKVWDTQTGTCIRTLAYHDQPVTTAAWTPDGTQFVTGSHDIEKPLTIWSNQSTDSVPVHNFKDLHIRTDDCALGTVWTQDPLLPPVDPSSDDYENRPLRLVAACRHTQSLHVLDFKSRHTIHRVVIDPIVTCVNLSRAGDEILLSVQNGEVWAMSMDDYEVKQKYLGSKQGKYVIRSCYGGVGETCVVSGGEDSKISIWHRLTGRLLEQLPGHTRGCVNAVAWNRAKPSMFASAGDDCRVRIWHKPLSPHYLAAIQASVNQPALPAGSDSQLNNALLSQSQLQQQQSQNMTGSTTSFASDFDEAQLQGQQMPTWGSVVPAVYRR